MVQTSIQARFSHLWIPMPLLLLGRFLLVCGHTGTYAPTWYQYLGFLSSILLLLTLEVTLTNGTKDSQSLIFLYQDLSGNFWCLKPGPGKRFY